MRIEKTNNSGCSIAQVTINKGQVQEYRLAKGSDRYVLPIPKKVLDKNPALVQNP